MFPVFVGMAMTAPELVPILFGEKWAAAVIIVQAAALPSLVSALGFFLGSVLTAVGRPGIRLALSIVQAVASASFVLIALRWGPAAVAIAMGLAALVGYIMNIAALHRDELSGARLSDRIAYRGDPELPPGSDSFRSTKLGSGSPR